MINHTILAIESSCDETAAAVYSTQQGIRSSVLFSQVPLHKMYGGVVPEIASRSHIEKINEIVTNALSEGQCTLGDLTAIAVTNTPGLPGSLLVGVCFAKSLAYAHTLPLVAVNHIEGHIASAYIEQEVPFPHICLTASGGHTSLYYVTDFGVFECIGTTQDDAAGEAFDKVAKLLDLGYPGGPTIEKFSAELGHEDFFHYPRLKMPGTNFSFSGLKTAVLYDLVNRSWYDMATKKLHATCTVDDKKRVCSSFLHCVGDILENRISHAFAQYPQAKALTFVGGVACNGYLATRLKNFAARHKKSCAIPTRKYCTDNAAMIAYVGHYKAQQEMFAPMTMDIFGN